MVPALAALLVSGCCWMRKCKCQAPLVQLVLQDGGAYCNGIAGGTTGVRQYDAFWKLLVDQKLSGGCGLETDWGGSPYYLVFYEESAGLADTVQMISVQSEEGGGDDCCDCPGPTTGFEYKVNGVAHSAASDTTWLPF